MKTDMRFLQLALAGGIGAFALRLAQRATGFEADTGLPVPGNVPAIALAVWFLVLAAAYVFAARASLPAEGENSPLFPDGFSSGPAALRAVTAAGIFLLVASGVLDLAAGVLPGPMVVTADGIAAPLREGLFSQREHLLLGMLSLVSAAGLFPVIPACRPRPEGEQKPFQGVLLLLPVCCLVVRLVLTYRAESVNPALADYYPDILAEVFLTLALYRFSSFAFRAGRSRRFALYAALAIAFCLAALADRPDPARLAFYAGGALTLFGLLLQRTASLPAEAAAS